MTKNYNNFLRIILFFVFIAAFPSKIYSQCAGDEGARIEICDVPNTANQAIDLFSKLPGSPSAGGVWTDDNGTGGLNKATGVLNIHLIRLSGVFHYTYTVTGAAGCTDNSATIEVTIGGYSGVTSPKVSVCSSQTNYNLFQTFDGEVLGPQSNGQWHNDTTNQFVGSSLYVKNLTGTFQFTYTMPAIGNCPAMSSTAVVTIFRAPESGENTNLNLCGSDDLSSYANYDLFNLISGQDSGGVWVENTGTGQLTFAGDHNIDIQKIYNTFGKGDYFFSYRVASTRGDICPDAQTTVRIRLEEKLDFTGAVIEVDSDICETEIPTANYSVTITKGPAVIPNGSYYITFSVSGPRAGTETVTVNLTNGVFIFPLKPEYFQRVGRFTVTILDIVHVNSARACRNIINNLSDELVIYPIPDLTGAIMAPVTTCQNEEARVTITNALKLPDGIYKILYNLSGANSANSQSAEVTFAGSVGSFIVPEIFNARSGTSNIRITSIENASCQNAADLRGEITIDPLPNATALRVQINNFCFGEPVPAAVSGLGTLTDVTLSYVLSNANTSVEQTVVVTTTNGNANFTIPAGLLLNTGTTRFTVTYLKNNTTTCGIAVTTVFDDFVLSPIPSAPAVTPVQPFCKVNGATVANLLPAGNQYKWYISETATTPLASTYLLKSENYYVKETSAAGCTSAASMVTVVINDTPVPELTADPKFCGLDNPTILDLSNITNSPSTVVWYDAANNGNLLPSSTLLVDEKTYYGFDLSTATNCYSSQSTPVIVSLTECEEFPGFFIPDGFSPNGDGVNDVFVIPDIDFLYPDYTIEIFNRYGNGMYRGGKDKPGWDGINYENKGLNGGVAPNGVYFYVINFNKGNKPPKQGRLYLNR